VNLAAAACSTLAAKLPFAVLRPDTLTWKLAGAAMLAASGTPPRGDHAFHRDELPALFEQLVVQMQDFSAPPATYRAQIGEPPLSTGNRIRVLSGLSGAGKTAWVAEAATHLATSAVYLDVGEMPGPALASAVAREVAAKLFGRSHGVLGEILLPGASGMETLGALNIKLGQEGLGVDVVIDNAHRLTPADLKPIVDQAKNIRFLLLCQPGAVTLAALLGVEHETLGSWDEDTIAAVIAEAGCVADYADCEGLSRLTGGLPYYVLNAATVAKREYDGAIAAVCGDVEAQTNLVATAQEVILKRAFDRMPDQMKEVVAALSLADVPSRARKRSRTSKKMQAHAPERHRLPAPGFLDIAATPSVRAARRRRWGAITSGEPSRAIDSSTGSLAILKAIEFFKQCGFPCQVARIGFVRHSWISDGVSFAELVLEAPDQLVIPLVVSSLSGALYKENLPWHPIISTSASERFGRRIGFRQPCTR
jgi:hypothetical protein